jgi:DNA repair protein RecN (Recombination protein N)
VRRSVKQNGKQSIFIENVPVSRPELAECMSFLFDIHGQHEHEGLLHKEAHRKHLDRFAGIENEVNDFNQLFIALTEKRKALAESQLSLAARNEKIELLEFAVKEIESANLKSGEKKLLEEEASRLQSFEKLYAFISEASALLYDDDASVLYAGRKLKGVLDNAYSIDGSLESIAARISSLFFEAEDVSSELRAYKDGLSFDERRLDEVVERINLINKLNKKYGATALANSDLLLTISIEDAILLYKENALKELASLSNIEEDRETLKKEISEREKEIYKSAKVLSAKRKAASEKLSVYITSVLKNLGMPAARFTAVLLTKGADTEGVTIGPYGAETIEFMFSANAGESEKELSRIASGGELSRVMLAIKTALIDIDTVETLIFDEIDAGIGGEVAIAVGEYLSTIGKKRQILCITHLASIASHAENHLLVDKLESGGRTITNVTELSYNERRAEIARLLSGEKSDAALAHADELLNKYCPVTKK